MIIHKSYRYELDPNNQQCGLLKKHCGVARFAWNWGLAQRILLFNTKQGRERLTSSIEQHRQLNALKKTAFPWMYEVSKHAPQHALQDLEMAYARFFRGLKQNHKFGKPKFKKKGIHDSFRINNDSTDKRKKSHIIRVEPRVIRLPRIGFIKTKEDTSKLYGRIINATITREGKKWFCSLCVEANQVIPQPIIGDIIGIDLGLNSFAITYNGSETKQILSPKPLKANLKKLRRVCRRVSRKQKHSINRKKAYLRLSNIHARVRNIRKDFLSKLTTSLAKNKSAIILEDLNVDGMIRNKRLSRSISDAGWGYFRRMLDYKTKWYGSKLIVIGRFTPTSKICSQCGSVNNELKLNDRTWLCMNCGVSHDRDENAAKNIRAIGVRLLNTESSSGINACGVDVSPLFEAIYGEAGSKQLNKTCRTVHYHKFDCKVIR